jgi:hypothetical protein
MTYGADPQLIALDYTVVRTAGKPSIRLDPYVAGGNTQRECDGTWYSVRAGDHIVATCWIKTDSTPYTGQDVAYAGGRIGVDFFAPRGDGTIAVVDSYPHSGAEHIASIVRWGTTTWVQKVWDLIVPSTVYTTEANGTPLTTPSQITEFVIWIQASPPTFAGKAWFADAELYINP